MVTPTPDGRTDRPRSRELVWAGVAGAVAVVSVALVTLLARADEPATSALPPSASSTLPGALTAPAPWPPNGETLRERLRAIGLPALTAEGRALHIHVEVEILIDGRPVPIPAGIGFDPGRRFVAPIHTHEADGLIHLESNELRAFRLGEFFDIWGVPLDERCLGPYCEGDGATLAFSVDGSPIAGDPRAIELRDREVIRVEYVGG